MANGGRVKRQPRAAGPFLALSRSFALGCCSFIAIISTAAAQSVTVTDDRGKTVTLARPAQRIVVLAPHLAELAFAAGAGGRLVGTVRFSDFPPAARDVPLVGDSARLELERIAALKPDLILAWKSGNAPADVERLESLGYPALVGETERIADIPRLLRSIGTLAGTRPEAERVAAEFEKEIWSLRERFAAVPKVRAFYMIWRKPLLTVGGTHVISDVIALCGGTNVFAGLRQLTPPVTLEAVIAARPQAILGGSDPAGGDTYTAEWRTRAPGPLQKLPVFYINPDLIQRPSPRIADGARAVCGALEQVRNSRPESRAPGKAGK
jgi:iron complex transport system substrate-binding protein